MGKRLLDSVLCDAVIDAFEEHLHAILNILTNYFHRLDCIYNKPFQLVVIPPDLDRDNAVMVERWVVQD